MVGWIKALFGVKTPEGLKNIVFVLDGSPDPPGTEREPRVGSGA